METSLSGNCVLIHYTFVSKIHQSESVIMSAYGANIGCKYCLRGFSGLPNFDSLHAL